MGSFAPIVFVGDAGPQFNEADHPRDSDGKFSSAPGGSGASVPHNPKGTNLNWQVAKVFKDHGLKKLKGTDLPTFLSKNGVKIVVHPTPGQKSSSKWAIHEPGGFEHKGSGHHTLKSLITKLTGEQAATTTGLELSKLAKTIHEESEGQKTPAGKTVSNIAQSYGLKFVEPVSPDTPWVSYEKDGYELDYSTATGYWAIANKDTANQVDTGTGLEELKKAMGFFGEKEGEWEPEEAFTVSAPAKAPEPAPKTNNSAISSLNSKGYTYAELDTANNVQYFTKPNGAKVQYNTKTEQWIAETPGHLTKEGKGAENLDKLMSGAAPVAKAGEPPPWKNSNQKVVLPSEAKKAEQQQAEYQKKQAEQQAEQAKKNAWKAEAQAKYEKLKAAAPHPTLPQKSALSSYSGSSYKSMNTKLRKEGSAAMSDKTISTLTEYLNGAVIPETLTLQRGVSDDFGTQFLSLATVGGIMEEKGFMSTSANADWHWGAVKMTVRVPKGVKGAAIANYSNHSHEGEVLLPPGRKYVVNELDLAKKSATVTILTDEQAAMVEQLLHLKGEE